MVAEEELIRHRFYHDFLEPRGLIALIATVLEARVASMLATGMSPREISERIEISFNTVCCHVSRIYLKTDTSRQTELVCLLTRLGLTIPD